jgi:phosphoglycolate phosphatase
MIKCVLFDLDGTLLDTSHDFAYALEKTCLEYNVPNVIYTELREIISEGGEAMIRLAFPTLEKDALAVRKAFFLKTYFDNISKHTSVFSGLEAGMQTLADKKIPWGIVTNKPEWLTNELIKQQAFPSKPAVVISGDTLADRKPHPAPLLLAAKTCQVAVENCIYLGDHPRDVLSGKNANMQTGAALFGFIPTNTHPADWQADYNFKTAEEISDFLNSL